MSINLNKEEVEVIKNAIQKFFPDAKIWIFGSRSKGKNQKFSDVDLLLDIGRPLTFSEISELKFELSETTLSYFIDIVDQNSVSEEFLNSIKKDLFSL